MTNVTTEAMGDSAIDQAMAQVGLHPDQAVTDAAAVAGPLITADLVDDDGVIVAAVGVLDTPSEADDGGPDNLLQVLASAAAVMAPGTEVQPGDPVGAGPDLAARFMMPTAVTAYSDGQVIQALHITVDDRRSDGGAGAQAPGAGFESGGVLGTTPASGGGLDKLINVSLDVSVELGRTRVTLADVLDYDVGSVVELDRAAGAPVDIRVNDTLLAQGEVVLIDDEYAVRITAIFDPHQ